MVTGLYLINKEENIIVRVSVKILRVKLGGNVLLGNSRL